MPSINGTLTLDGRPFTGAWIETNSHLPSVSVKLVAPSRGRGLKRVFGVILDMIDGRPFTGAWIETYKAISLTRGGLVAPSRGRGLKHDMGRYQTNSSRGNGFSHTVKVEGSFTIDNNVL